MEEYELISSSNYNYLYWDMNQQIVHHTTTGCNLRTGDMLASGTIYGPEKNSRGSMLELTWGWSEPLKLSNGEERLALEDGDTVMLKGWCQGDNYRIGLLNMQSSKLSSVGIPSTNYGMAVVERRILSNSRISSFLVNKQSINQQSNQQNQLQANLII